MITLHPIEEEVHVDRQRRTRGGSPDECVNRLLFHPKAFCDAHGELKVEDFRFSEAALAKLGKEVTQHRARLRTRARLAEQREEKGLPAEQQGQSRLAQRMQSNFYATAPPASKPLSRGQCVDPVPLLSCMGLRKTRLSFEEKVGVIHKLFVGKETQTVVAREYQVTPAAICALSRKFRTDKEWFVGLQRKREGTSRRRAVIKAEVVKCLEELAFIDSAHFVTRRLEGSGLEKVRDAEVASVMKYDVDLRFRQVKATNPHCNSERSLVLRQQFALRLLNLWGSRPRWFNIDESWLGMSDFRRAKWLPVDVPRTTTKAALAPRVSFIVALDNHGEVYWALNQGNSNADVMCLFLRALVTRLNQEGRHWRKRTAIYWDGAKYHSALETLRVAKELDIPLAVSGPYGYDVAPCEKFFGEFKRADVNPRHVKTGKG